MNMCQVLNILKIYNIFFNFLCNVLDKKEIPPILRNEYHSKDDDIDNEITYGIVESNELLNADEKPNLESGIINEAHYIFKYFLYFL